MASEEIIKLLTEIRDLQQQSIEVYKENSRMLLQRYDGSVKVTEKRWKWLIVFVVIVAIAYFLTSIVAMLLSPTRG